MDKNEQRKSYLIKNTAIFALGNMASKLITFILIPIYTGFLSTSEYGIIDLITAVCTVLAPILTLNISESVMRFSLDEETSYSKIISIATFIYVISIIVGAVILPINTLFTETSEYSMYIYFYVLSLSGSQLYLAYLKGKELLLLYTIGNILLTFFSAGLNILFLCYFNMGITGYFTAFIIASFAIMMYAFIVGNVVDDLKKFSIDKKLFYEMIKFSVVLIPNTFMWWVMNSSDRLMVSSMVNVAANGIYAISYKLPTLVSNVMQIFNQAWSYSAIKEAGQNDEEAYNNEILKNVTCLSIILGVTIISFGKIFLVIYVSDEFFDSWKYVPFLTIGCVYLAIGTFIATSYTVHKDSLGYLFSGLLGAVTNIILNFLMIPFFYVYGAAIATCISYISVFIFRLIHTRKYIHYKVVNRYFIIGTILMITDCYLMYLSNIIAQLIQILIFILLIVLYTKVWLPILKSLIKFGKCNKKSED